MHQQTAYGNFQVVSKENVSQRLQVKTLYTVNVKLILNRAFTLNKTNMELTDDGLEFPQTLSQNEQLEINTSVLSTNKEGKISVEMEIPLYIYIIASCINAVIFITGTFGNFLVIVVVIAVRNMRTPTNMFLLNLSAADILVLLVCQPAGLLEFFGKDRWFLGKLMCKIMFFFLHSFVVSSSLLC